MGQVERVRCPGRVEQSKRAGRGDGEHREVSARPLLGDGGAQEPVVAAAAHFDHQGVVARRQLNRATDAGRSAGYLGDFGLVEPRPRAAGCLQFQNGAHRGGGPQYR